MPDTPLTDDYVAELLKKDATRNQNRYLTSSLGGLLGGSRPRGNAPRPNTRFLRNIVRDADTHNAALRKKEEEESRARLRGLKREDGDKSEEKSRRRKEGLSPRERHHHNRERSRDRDDKRRRSRSPRRDHHKARDRSRERRHRDSDKYDRRDRSPRDRTKRRDGDRSSHRSSKTNRPRSPSSQSDSDPLESIIGPRPPPKTLPRGRGAHKTSSAMDARFDPNYDPKADVNLSENEAEGDDWDMAFEALRDRAKWKKSGAERLRAAGFTEEEVSNFEKGGGGGGKRFEDGEGDIWNVKWRKRGEKREWDHGKVVDGEYMDLKPEWGRLKDT